jgi:wobble nucleotide-excising tRNase
MSDRTPEQINHNLDQVLAIAFENTRGIAELRQGFAEVTATVAALNTYIQNRTQQHDLELDDHDERVERLEQILLNHDANMAEIKDVQKDIRQILQIMAARFAGEPPTGDNN